MNAIASDDDGGVWTCGTAVGGYEFPGVEEEIIQARRGGKYRDAMNDSNSEGMVRGDVSRPPPSSQQYHPSATSHNHLPPPSQSPISATAHNPLRHDKTPVPIPLGEKPTLSPYPRPAVRARPPSICHGASGIV
ncbi:hypothetical protein K440DRAFT_92637 [Wilcoxina mikolae CBS 423.85]|nr:hypothetical protein K440DRAFT_92637 [Wilcoxina mikolae CBS 423.85]